MQKLRFVTPNGLVEKNFDGGQKGKYYLWTTHHSHSDQLHYGTVEVISHGGNNLVLRTKTDCGSLVQSFSLKKEREPVGYQFLCPEGQTPSLNTLNYGRKVRWNGKEYRVWYTSDKDAPQRLTANEVHIKPYYNRRTLRRRMEQNVEVGV